MAIVADINLMVAALLLSYALSYGSSVTTYSNAVGPVLVGSNYVDENKVWWKLGALTAIVGTVALLVLGLPYWKILGLW